MHQGRLPVHGWAFLLLWPSILGPGKSKEG